MAKQATAMRVFIASPGDVEHERNALARVLTDVNLALEALAPGQPFVLQLVRWETHVHPDFGRPQSVINDQIEDYDIFVGVMWKRFGTPTGQAESGTQEEFRLAHDRWAAGGRPRILFYFSDYAIPANLSSADLGQLQKVVAFREELSHQGLVKSYASPEEFPDVVRRDLIRLVGRILHGEQAADAKSRPFARREGDVGLELVRPQIIDLAKEYEHLRATMAPGDQRSQAMEAAAARMRALAADTYPMLGELAESTSAGQRLAAVSLLEVTPNDAYVDWLANRLSPEAEKPFVQYHAALALLHAVRELDPLTFPKLEAAVSNAVAFTADLPRGTDRARVVRTTHEELQRRRASLEHPD